MHGIFSPRRVYDAGCGIGSYLEGFASLGCEIAGCELHWDIAGEFAAEPVRGVVRSHDLATPLREPIHSDLTLSIEVAEHIDAAHASVVARNICGVSSRYIVMTAAEPGQRGHGHINCQPKEYWEWKFGNNNFVLDKELTAEFIKEMKLGYHMGWLTNNVQIFRGYGDVCYEQIIREETPQAKRVASLIKKLHEEKKL